MISSQAVWSYQRCHLQRTKIDQGISSQGAVSHLSVAGRPFTGSHSYKFSGWRVELASLWRAPIGRLWRRLLVSLTGMRERPHRRGTQSKRGVMCAPLMPGLIKTAAKCPQPCETHPVIGLLTSQCFRTTHGRTRRRRREPGGTARLWCQPHRNPSAIAATATAARMMSGKGG